MMKPLIMLSVFLAIIVFAIYMPVLRQHIFYRKARIDFEREIEQIPAIYSKCCLIITDCLGVGSAQNSDVTFEQAHKNHEIAMNAIVKIINGLEK